MLTDNLQRETVCLILGGGQGTRLFPLTRERCKPAVPLGGKFRFIDVALSNAINSGLRQIFVLTQHNSASLNNHVARTYKFDAFATGFVAILAAEQRYGFDSPSWFQGTADAIRQNLRYLQNPSFRNVLIMPGDHLCRLNLRRLLELHEYRNADVTLASAVVNRADAARFRVLKLGENGRLAQVVRKPTTSEQLDPLRLTEKERTIFGVRRPAPQEEQYLGFMGIYLFRREVLEQLLRHTEDQDLGKDTLHRLERDYSTWCHVYNDYWRDIGTISSYYEASVGLTQDDPPFHFHDAEAPIYTHARFLPPARLYRSSLDGALVADGAVVEASEVSRSIIGVRSHIRTGCEVSHSILFGADAFDGENRRAAAFSSDNVPGLGLGPRCVVRRAIIDKNARIGAGCRLTNERGLQHADGENGAWFIRDGVIIIPKYSVLEPGTVI